MSLDPYEPCPCGSGKKLKFCCADIVGEMETVRKMNSSGQTQACFSKLDKLNEQHPDNPWVLNYRASLWLAQGIPHAAIEDLTVVLENHPEHQMGLVLFANARFAAEGFQAAKAAIHRCFQKCIRDLPSFVGDLSMNIAMQMMHEQNYMAARQHLAFAIRFVSEDDREVVFQRLHEFDSNVEIPYPLRSVHQLAEEGIADEAAADVDKARRLCEIGCWGPAAKVYQKLTESHPENAALFQNLGYCRAWDGNAAEAAAALHQASSLEQDFANAVEHETVAQLLDRLLIEDRVYVEGWIFEIDSASKALGKFEGKSQFARLPDATQQADEETRLAGIFQVLDRPTAGIELTPESALDDVPNVVGHFSIYDKDRETEEAAYAFFTGFQSEKFEAARQEIIAALSDGLVGEPRREEDLAEDSVAAEEHALFWRWHCPENTSVVVRRALEQQQWRRITEDVWPEIPLHGLGGKTPKQVHGNDELKVMRLAALYVFDAFCSGNSYVMDFDAMCKLVGVEALPTIDADTETPIGRFSAMQLKRLNAKSLADDQLIYVSNRAIMLHHGAFLYDTLEELLTRTACHSRVGDLAEVFQTQIQLCAERYRRDLAFEWLDKARGWADQQPNRFELGLQWKMRELMLRIEDPTDPKLAELFREIGAKYGPKLPQVNEYLQAIAQSFGLTHLFGDQIVSPAAASEASEGLWTPDGPQGEAQENKLWLPGQD